MTLKCDDAQTWIPKALGGDLGSSEQEQLDAHLLVCPACSGEHQLCADTLEQLRAASDVPLPRHFFIYPQDHRSSLTDAFSVLIRRKFLVGLTAALVVFVTVGLILSRFQFRAEGGVYSFSFGRSLSSKPSVSSQTPDIAALKGELIRLLDARSQRERLESMGVVREEVRRANRKLSSQQQRQWETALAALQARLHDRVEDQSIALKAGLDRSVGNLYQTLQLQRQQDLVMTQNRLDRITAQGALKDKETDEILFTLLQVAEVK
jgi:hypothetical protein